MTRGFGAIVVLAAAGAIALGLAGCSKSGSGGSTAARDVKAPAQEGGAPPGNVDAAPNQAAGAGGAPAKVPDQLPPDSRSLIYTGTVTVRVDDVGRAASDTTTAAVSAGGFVGGDDRHSDASRSEARMVLRVPSDKFSSVIDAIARLGKEESRALNTQDVTEQVADVDARLANAQASVDRIRALMARAQTIGEITSLEAELSRREGDLESLKARKRKLGDLTALSTVTAVLLGKEATPKKDEPKTGFLAGLDAGWKSFVASMRILVTVVGALLPWMLALGVPLVLVFWVARRTRRGRPVSLLAAVPAGPQPVVAPPVVPPAPAGAPVAHRPAVPPEDPTPEH